MYRVKITVVKKLSTADVYGENLENDTADDFKTLCPVVDEGQEFIVEEDGKVPAGFCAWAWHDIQREVWTIRNGGGFPWIKKEGMLYACCTDGLRPVFFKLERI